LQCQHDFPGTHFFNLMRELNDIPPPPPPPHQSSLRARRIRLDLRSLPSLGEREREREERRGEEGHGDGESGPREELPHLDGWPARVASPRWRRVAASTPA
jgi:hypothetical protein